MGDAAHGGMPSVRSQRFSAVAYYSPIQNMACYQIGMLAFSRLVFIRFPRTYPLIFLPREGG